MRLIYFIVVTSFLSVNCFAQTSKYSLTAGGGFYKAPKYASDVKFLASFDLGIQRKLSERFSVAAEVETGKFKWNFFGNSQTTYDRALRTLLVGDLVSTPKTKVSLGAGVGLLRSIDNVVTRVRDNMGNIDFKLQTYTNTRVTAPLRVSASRKVNKILALGVKSTYTISEQFNRRLGFGAFLSFQL